MEILCSNNVLAIPYRTKLNTFPSPVCLSSSFHGINFNPLIRVINDSKRRIRVGATVCYYSAPNVDQLQWLSTISTSVLMLVKGTAIHKSFLVPLLALQAPSSIISWMRGEYGIWCAFMALLVRLFFVIPGVFELPLMALLIIIVAPYQVMNLRGKQEGVILSLVIASYLAFHHFTSAGGLKKAFDQGSIIATLAIIFTVGVPCLLLI
ncbi:hypothetical protein LIER_37817 [Lithospermum erythrorhizon]|uniref:Uncharacterized protein n=1 Tax=Lithospermum erythrorhizon TaxID=34254 RepID=A0AAV3PQZ3_LITER